MKPYIPKKIPLDKLDWLKFINLIGKANFELARYQGILESILNPNILLSPLTTQEAVLSSKIEGTQATLEEVMKYEANVRMDEVKKGDIQEIINYRIALSYATDRLKTRPLNLNLIKEIHNLLLNGVRGKDKAKGEFRRIQNWVGPPGYPIENARYIPPPPERLMEFLDNFEKYIHSDEKDILVQLAIVHAQFEIIHPFIDGNGRVGRILIPLFLFEKKILTNPMFYISAYLDENRNEYYNRLKNITDNNKWEDWIIFFLSTITEQARINYEKAKAILTLYENMKSRVANLIKSQYSINALDAIFRYPIFNTVDFIKRSKIPKASAMRIIKALKEKDILNVLREGRGRSSSVLIFNELIRIVK